MSFLLTNGIKTDNLQLYLKDVFYLNFKLYPNDVPYNTEIGMNRRVNSIDKVTLTDNFRSNITNLIDRLNTRHGITLVLEELEVYVEEIYVSIKIDESEIVEYTMPISN